MARKARLAAVLLAALLLAACSVGGGPLGATAPGSRASTDTSKTAAKTRGTTPAACTPVADAVDRVERSVVRIETPPDAKGEISAGTGFVVDSDVVLTNEHVITGFTRVFATFRDGRRAIGRISAENDAQDLALIQVETGQVPPIVWGDDRTLSKGTPIMAIGYAMDRRGPPTRSSGSYLQTYVDPPTGQAYLLSDLRLDHGDSGGPLLNQCGQVVGVNTAKIRDADRAGLSIPEFLAHRWTVDQLQQQH